MLIFQGVPTLLRRTCSSKKKEAIGMRKLCKPWKAWEISKSWTFPQKTNMWSVTDTENMMWDLFFGCSPRKANVFGLGFSKRNLMHKLGCQTRPDTRDAIVANGIKPCKIRGKSPYQPVFRRISEPSLNLESCKRNKLNSKPWTLPRSKASILHCHADATCIMRCDQGILKMSGDI